MDKTNLEIIKKLRLATGAGIIDCKNAFQEAKGDFAKAKKILEKKALKKAKEKINRPTAQGFIATYTHSTGKIGAMVEILSETDFVARNEEFRQFAKEICLQIAAMNPKNLKELLKQEYIRDPAKTINELMKSNIVKFGENIKIGRFARFEI